MLRVQANLDVTLGSAATSCAAPGHTPRPAARTEGYEDQVRQGIRERIRQGVGS